MTITVAALFVAADGPYAHLGGVEIWTEAPSSLSLFGAGSRADARRYAGPHPVVAHPPCERWGRYWHGGPSAKVRRVLGDDGGCFESALASVRRWRGVLEHPEASAAWDAFGINRPPKSGGWIEADERGGYTCCVEQGHYGHRARKATWLYAIGCDLPELTWGASSGSRLDQGFHTREERRDGKARGLDVERQVDRLSSRECWETPIAFRDVLLAMARSAAR